MASIRKSPVAVFAYIANINEGATLKDHLETAKIPRANPPPGLNFLPIAKGVYAAEDPESGKRFVKIEKGTKLQINTVTLPDGSTTKVYVPIE